MYRYTPEYLATIKKHWQQYLGQGQPFPEEIEGIRPDILDSWKRSRSYGVKTGNALESSLSKSMFSKVLETNADLIRIAYPYIENLYNLVTGTGFVIHLADKNGCILKCLCDDELMHSLITDVSNLEEGAVRREDVTGTDSTSLCLAVDAPVQVMAEEHYMKENHAFFCSSAPIHRESELIGILTIMGKREFYQSHTLGMVCVAVDGIEKEICIQNAYDDLARTNSLLSSTINAMSAGIVIMDANKKILQCNQKFLNIFRLESGLDVKNCHIYTILNPSSVPKTVQAFDANISSVEFTAVTLEGYSIDISAEIRLIFGDEQTLQNIVFIIEEQKKINQMVTRASGFSARYTFDSIIGDSDEIQYVKNMGVSAAHSFSNVLITGESGTGKELVAQSIHNASDRVNSPFIAINCGSIPKNLIESELFGYEAGAFTGAKNNGNPGKFELADGGTLFLDEIGDMPLELQVSLLRVLQTHEVTRLGGKYPKKVDVRVIAATNVDLLKAVETKNFRRDLYYRLNVLGITIPPLRKRPGDILPLVNHFIDIYTCSMNKTIQDVQPDVIHFLEQYNWPGNIRELENVIERAINLAQESTLTIGELPVNLVESARNPFAFDERKHPRAADASADRTLKLSPREVKERKTFIAALKKEQGSVEKAALLLNIPVSTLYRKLRKYKVYAKDYRK